MNCINIGIELKTKRHIVFIGCLLCASIVRAADFWPVAMHQPDSARDTICYMAQVSAVASTGKSAPFWLHAGENGNISSAPFSGNISAGVYKPATRPSRWYDYDFAVILTGRFDTERATGYFRQLYAHARLYIIDITAGIKPMVCGVQNPKLSTGGLLFSGNAQPLPRISIGIDEYIPFPGLFGYCEVKGGITHGWFVDDSRLDKTIATTGTLLHYKFAGMRLGGMLPVNFSYEIHHAAQWGGTSPEFGKYDVSFKAFKHIFMAGAGGNNRSDQLNAEGNHIGFQQLALTGKWSQWNITAYWQTIFEDKSASFIGNTNQTDGLWGLSVQQTQWRFIHSLTYEFLNTTAQDGSWHDRDGLVYGGRSNYYNNSNYKQGWTHFSRTIGNPLLSPSNNRVRTHFIGLAGDIYGFEYRVIGSYTRNWGTYKAPSMSRNTALMLEVTKHVEQAWGLDFSLRMAADFGTQFGNQFGAMLTVSKRGLIHSY